MSSSPKRLRIIAWNRSVALRGIAGVFLLTALLAGCAGIQRVEPQARGTLRFSGEPRDALIEVDEVHLGPISMFEKKGLLLLPGEHRIIVRREGYFPAYRIVTVSAGEVAVLEVELREIPL